MADFKTHLQVGTAVGFVFSVISVFTGLVHNFSMAILVFLAASFGSFLPDTDSNSSLPVKIIFTLYAYLAAGLTVYFFYENGEPWYLAILVSVLEYVAVYWGMRKFFMKLTVHRGIFHSIPAFILSFLLTLLLSLIMNIPTEEKFAIALAVSLGYLSHLILDEIYSVNILNKPLKKEKKKFISLKKSFGSALDLGFGGKHSYPAFISYAMIIILIIILFPLLKEIFGILFKT